MSYLQQCGHEEEMQQLREALELENLTKLAEVVSGMRVLGIPVQYLHHYAMFSAVSGCEDVYVRPVNGLFVFPDGKEYSVAVLKVALREYNMSAQLMGCKEKNGE